MKWSQYSTVPRVSCIVTGTVLGLLAAILVSIVYNPGHMTNTDTFNTATLRRLGSLCDCEQFIAARMQDYPAQRARFSTKTGYAFDATVDDMSTVGQCRAVQVYAIFRHGSRDPGKKDITAFSELWHRVWSLNQGAAGLTTLGKKLVKWSNRFTVENSSLLSESGMKELYCIGKRFLKRFPVLFTEGYSTDRHSFTSTKLQRAIMSAHSFAAGLFGTNGDPYKPVDLVTREQNEDTHLRFHKMCPAMLMHTKNKTLQGYIEGYLQQPAVTLVLENVQNKLDPEGKAWNVTAEEMMTMFRLCAFEKALYHHSSWCELFTDEDQAVMEYYLDMKMYWKRGYGHPVCSHMSCPLITDIIEAMVAMVQSLKKKDAPHSQTSKTALFKFAHAETIVPLVGLLGLFRDSKHLTVDGYNFHKQRKFRVSRFASFSGNLMFVLYRCQQNEDGDDYRVRVLVNEEPVEVPHPLCSDSSGGCPLTRLPEILQNTTGGLFTLPCQLDDVCSH